MTLLRRPPSLLLLAGLFAASLCACGGNGAVGGEPEAPADPAASEGEPVTPPFAVRGDCHGLFLYYFDADGVHAAESRDDVPEVARRRVRVESPRLAPDERLDPEWVYIADLRQPGADGNYAVRKLPRETFDAWVDHATGDDAPAAVAAAAPVIIYGAPWCSACRALESYLDSIGVPYIDKDIERDADARAEMQRKARAAGVPATGIPVVDIDGTILQGFDRARVDRALAARHAAPPSPAAPAPAAPTGVAQPAPGTVPI